MRQILALAVAALSLAACVSRGPDPVVGLRSTWQECVVRSVAAQPGRFAEPEASVEIGFQACRTEEDVIRAYFLNLGASPAEYEPTLAVMRARLKTTIVQTIRQGPSR